MTMIETIMLELSEKFKYEHRKIDVIEQSVDSDTRRITAAIYDVGYQLVKAMKAMREEEHDRAPVDVPGQCRGPG